MKKAKDKRDHLQQMTANKRNDAERVRDQALVAELDLKGFSNAEITAYLNNRVDVDYTLSASQIAYDKKKGRKEYLERTLEATRDIVKEELEKLRLVEREAWRGWEKSLDAVEEVKEIAQIRRMVDEEAAWDEQLFVTTVEKFVAKQSGNPKFLEVMLHCTDRRAKLMGLYINRAHLVMEERKSVAVKMFEGVHPGMWDDERYDVVDGEILVDGRAIGDGKSNGRE